MAMDAAELGRWMRFAAKGGIGRCVAVRDCEAQVVGDLMFFEGDEIIVLHQVPSTTSTNDIQASEQAGTQFLGYCEEIVGRFNSRDVRFTTKLKKAVMTKRVSSSSPATPTVLASASASSISASSPVPGISASNSTSSTSQSPVMSALSPSPSISSTVYASSGLTNSPRASPAPSTFSTASSSTLGIHEPRMSASSSAQILKSGGGLGMNGGMSDSLERRSSAAASASATRTASPLQRSYTSPSPSVPASTSMHIPSSTSISGTSALTTSPTTTSFVSFSPTPSSSSVTPSPREATFPSSISSSSVPPVHSSSAAQAARSASYSASDSARNSPSPVLHHSRSLGSTAASSSSSVPGSSSSSPIPSSPSPRMQALPLQPHSQQQHRYTAHAPSPLSFATASALSQRVTSSSSFSRSSSYSNSRSSNTGTGTPTSPAFSATGTLSPTSPTFSTSSFSEMSMGHSSGRDGLTPTASSVNGSLTPTGTNPLRITKRSPSLGSSSVIPGLRSPPPVSPLPELPAGQASSASSGVGGPGGSGSTTYANTSGDSGSEAEAGLCFAASSTPALASSPPSSSNSIEPSTLTASYPPPFVSPQPAHLPASHTAPPPPALDLPSIAEATPPSPSSAPQTSTTAMSESAMNSAYAARMAFTPLPSSVGGSGFGAIATRVEDEPMAASLATVAVMRDEVTTNERIDGDTDAVVKPRVEETSTTAANDIGLSLLQLQDLADGMYSYGSDSDSDSDSQYSHNSYQAANADASARGGSGSRERSAIGLGSGPSSRAASRSDGKVVEGVGMVDRNGRRKSVVPGASGSGGKRATLRASTFIEPGSAGRARAGTGVEARGLDDGDDGGSDEGTVEGVAYYSLGADADSDGPKTEEAADEAAKALLAKMEAMNAMVAAMPAFPTKPSPGVVARSAVASSPTGGSSSSAGSAAGAARSGTHLSPTSPIFPQGASERERRPSLVSAHSSHSVHSVRSGASGATSGSGEDYDIYDSYRYSRYSVLSGRSGTNQPHTFAPASPPRAGGRRMDSMGSVDESYEDRVGFEQGPPTRGLDMVLDELSFGDVDARGGGAMTNGDAVGGKPTHDRTMSVDSEASVYTQDSSEAAKEATLGASTGSNSTGTSTAAGAHTTATTARPAPLDLSKDADVPSKSVTSPLLHTSWGSAASSAQSFAPPFDVNSPSFGVQAHSLVGTLGVERAGEVKSARAAVEERVTSPGLESAMRQRIEDEHVGEAGDRSVSTIVEGAGLGQGIVIEDDEELPSRIEDDGLGMDDTMTSSNTRHSRASGSPEPEANILHGLAPVLVVANRSPSPVDADSAIPAAVPRPPRSAGLSPFAASNQRRSIFLPHPGAPKAPSQVDGDNTADQLPSTAASTQPAARLASSPPLHGAQHTPPVHQHPHTYSPPAPIPRPTLFQMIQISLTTPPRPLPPILPGMKPPPPPLMKGPTIYGRTDLDLSAAVGPVPISWSIDPFLVPPKTSGNAANGGGKSKIAGGAVGQGQALPSVGIGRGYPTRSMSMGANLGAAAVPTTSSPLAKSTSMAASTSQPAPVNQPPVPVFTASTALVAPSPLSDTVGTSAGAGAGAGGALPRANFVPHAPGLRPRSRSFSAFNSTSSGSSRPGDIPRSHEEPSSSPRGSNGSSMPLPSLSSASSTATLTSSSSIGSSLSTAAPSTTSVAAPILKPPIPTAPKPIPKPSSTLTSKKPSSLSLRSSPLSTSLSVGGGLKSPKAPSSPLAMSMVVAQRDSVIDAPDDHERGSKDTGRQPGPDPSQLRLRAKGSMPNLGSSSSSASFSSTVSPPPRFTSPLSIGGVTGDSNSSTAPSMTRTTGAGTKDDVIDDEVMSMSSPVSMREPRSPPPFAGLPLLVPPQQQQPHLQEPPSPSLQGPKSPVSPSTHQAGFFPSPNPPSTQGQTKPQRQPSLRNKLSLPNLRRKHSRPEEEENERERDIRGHTHLLQRRDQRERDDTLDVERERELLQVRDLEFELVRPSLPAAQREWGAARTSEDSGVLGRDNGSFDYSNFNNGGPFRGGDAASRGSFESRGSLDMRGNGTGHGGERTEGSRLRPTSPAFSVASGTPSSLSLSRQRSPTIDTPWSSNSESPSSSGEKSSNPAEIEAHRARELRWLSLLSSSPSSGAAAYTLPPQPTSNLSSYPSSSTPVSSSSGSAAAYTPNPLAKSRKTRKLLLESSVPSSVRFRVWVFLTDARARAVPGVYNALVGRGVGRVRDAVVAEVRRDVRVEHDRLVTRATSPSLASRSSVSQIDDGAEDESLAAAKPFTPSQLGDAPVTTLLLAYLNMVPDITYSRGLIHVLGHLLMLSPDEDAFWIFVSMMDNWLRGYFIVLQGNGAATASTIPVAPQMDVDALLFTRALEANEPQVAKRLLVDVGLSGVAICSSWFSGVFVGTLPVDHLNRIWDLFLFEGIPLLVRIGIALISCLKRHLLAPLPLASSISASSSLSSSSSPSSSTSSSQSPHATTLLALLHTPPLAALPPSPDAFITIALAVKLKDDEVRKQRVKMEQQVSLKMRQQYQASSTSSLAPPGHRPGSLRGSFQALRAGGSVISLPRATG
ncbi:hypothetical protein D9619_012495 [Psilocybe cf. subviscida]|uniref:Rab-GAP TBC domain-containing protein n=1 Tax=Psilocybe cf. subviscida TaxID=2480587 RepID=A0A8H5ER82_9AGAR|nr:hypothetical protein D9619_012495 [Psilocybe cf. subviscida]